MVKLNLGCCVSNKTKYKSYKLKVAEMPVIFFKIIFIINSLLGN
jgi:hypothetical protein